jgi:histone H3/H4
VAQRSAATTLWGRYSHLYLVSYREQKKSDHFTVPVAAFERLVRELVKDKSEGRVTRITESAFAALQADTEDFMVGFLRLAHRFALHDHRKTLTAADVTLAKEIVLLTPNLSEQTQI